jgi:hypothetical protein
LTAIAHIAVKIDTSLGGTTNRQFGDSFLLKSNIPITTYTYDPDPLIVISKNVNEKGLVVMSGQFYKQQYLTFYQATIRMLKVNGLQDGAKIYTPTISIIKPSEL